MHANAYPVRTGSQVPPGPRAVPASHTVLGPACPGVPVGTAGAEPEANRVFASLPLATRQRWRPLLEAIELPPGQVLYESGYPLSHVVFPTSAIVSLQYLTENGASTELASVGNDGVVGIPLLTGGQTTSSRAVVLCAGRGYRLHGSLVQHEFDTGGAAMRPLLCYVQALFTQVAQTVTCSRHHVLDQQLCRLLLQTLDRHQGSGLALTHDMLAIRLGVRRESVTASALALRRAELIDYARGHISVLDRRGLEQRCCECYAVVRDECERLLPRLTPESSGNRWAPLRPGDDAQGSAASRSPAASCRTRPAATPWAVC